MTDDWTKLKLWRRVCAAMAPDREWLEEDEYSVSGKNWSHAKKIVGSIRARMRERERRSVKQLEEGAILSEITTRIKMNYPRLSVFPKVGSPIWGRKSNRSVDIKVGYMWHRTVYNNLYFKGLLSSDWFILKAERYKINVRNVVLYQCMGFNIRTGENKELFIGEALTDEGSKFFLSHTAKSALDNAYSHVSNRLTAMIKGELNDQ